MERLRSTLRRASHRLCARIATPLAALCLLLLAGHAAGALTIQCIEESKYKHLYEIFGGDPVKFAAYLDVDTTKHRLPEPEFCRAALIGGPVGEKDEYEKIFEFIAAQKGWLAAIHLSSGGGSRQSGQRLGYLVRAFRLKTVTARNVSSRLVYEPDFGPPPLPPVESGIGAPRAPGQAPRCALKDQVPTDSRNTGAISGMVRPRFFEPTSEQGVDRQGPAYRSLNVSAPDPKLCQQACLDEARCQAWSYRAPEGRTDKRPYCELKERVLDLKKDRFTVSGLARATALDATYDEGGYSSSPTIRQATLSGPDARLCQKACMDEPRCRSWTYRKPEGARDGQPRCWLEEGRTEWKSSKHFVSGLVIRLQYADPTFEKDTTLGGNHYKFTRLPSDDARLCQKLCIDDEKCQSWLFEPSTSRKSKEPGCWLHDHVGKRGTSKGAVAGVITRVHNFKPTFETDSHRPGSDYRQFDMTVADPLVCQKSCIDDAKCRAWTYTKPDPAYLIAAMSGWDAYGSRRQTIAALTAPRNNSCASACTYLHYGGLDRSGVVEVHRGNQGYEEMSRQAESLTVSEARVRAYLQYLDPGEDIIRLVFATSGTTVAAVRPLRFPRYAHDFLINRCGSDPEQLQRLETQLTLTINELRPADADVTLDVDSLRGARARLNLERRKIELCVARAHENDRLAAFQKLCGAGCDQPKLTGEFDDALKKILENK